MKLSNIKIGVFSFIIVLLLMPIGHAIMVLNEKIFVHQKFIGAFVIGLLGLIMLFFGIKKNKHKSTATILGFLAGVLVWTGWIEFSFVWIAEKLNVPALIENGKIATKPEYLIMPSSIGLLASVFLLFLFTRTRCQYIRWYQKIFGLKEDIKIETKVERPVVAITFIETIMVLWTFYIVLLLVYDKDIAGDNHPLTYLVAFGSLFWSIYLGMKLIKIQKFDYAIRYAIPTVIIFWNFVEVLGRWNLFKEIWIHPFEHWMEITMLTLLLLGFIVYYVMESRMEKKNLPLGT